MELIHDRNALITVLSDLLKQLAKQKSAPYPIWDPTADSLIVLEQTNNLSEAIRLACVYVYHLDVGMSEHTEEVSYTADGYIEPMTDSGLWQLLSLVLNKKEQPTVKSLRQSLEKLSDTKIETKTHNIAVVGNLSNLSSQQMTGVQDVARFYQEVGNISFNPASIILPPAREDINYPFYVLPQLDYDWIWQKCLQTFPEKVWIYDDAVKAGTKPLSSLLDLIKHPDERDPNKQGAYGLMMRYEQEANDEYADKSAEWIKTQHILTMTLRERLLFSLFYYWKEKKYLDVQKITLCSGSRDADGDVPRVNWYSDNELYVHGGKTVDSHEGARARVVVSSF